MKKIQLLQRRDFGTTLNDSIEFVRYNLVRYSKAFLYFVMPPLLLLMIAITYFFGTLTHTFLNFGRSYSNFADMLHYNMQQIATSFLLILVMFLLGSVVFLIHSLLAYEYVLLYDAKEDPSAITLDELWGRISGNILYMIGSYLGLFLVYTVLGLATGGILVLVMMKARFLGVLLFIFAGFAWIYFAIPLSNFFIIRLRERLGIFESIGRCYTLARGNWWRTFGVLLIMGFLSYILQTVCVMPFMMVNMVVTFHSISQSAADPGAMFTPVYGIMQAVSMAVGLYFSAMVSFATSINYFSLVESTDNTSLLQEIESIGEKTEKKFTQEGEY